MNITKLFLTVAPLALATPAWAAGADSSAANESGSAAHDSASLPPAPQKEVFSTGVARGRDILDAAISTSALKETEIEKFGALSLGEVLRNIPGLRVEASGGEGLANITIRGLPLAQSGSKFMQLEENGLPILEFGDIAFASPDLFLRTDLSLASVEAIRGGSASTFASNSPGGVINLMDKTGDVEGGAVQASTGLSYGEYRADFDYGHKLSDTLRFHVGGFFRTGQGPRNVGSDSAYHGGQIKLNVTKTLDNGYIRLYAKYLDDRTPEYMHVPLAVTGTNSDPHYSALPGFDPRYDTLLSRNVVSTVTLDTNNKPETIDMQSGQHAKEKSIGLDANLNFGEWNVSEKFKFSAMSSTVTQIYPVPMFTMPAGTIGYFLGGAGSTLSYATGPNAGAVINPATLNGNGLIVPVVNMYTQLPNLNYLVNDLRASRVWKAAGGELTTTFGLYKSHQTIAQDWLWNSMLYDLAGGGNANLINITSAGGTPVTQNGIYAYDATFYGSPIRERFNIDYNVTAPYASLNFHLGKLSVGGSVRFDIVTVRGTRQGGLLDGTDQTIADVNGDGIVPTLGQCLAPQSSPECRVGYFTANTYPVHYNVHYVSYSAGANYRVADDMSVFARHSRGGRASADRVAFLYVAPTGGLVDPSYGVDYVNQTELGAKYRHGDLSAFVTGFLATATEHNFQINRGYKAYGVEFEGAWQHGPYHLTAGATWTHAQITADQYNPGDVNNTPHHQPKLLFQATPQYETGLFTIGANITGTTSSYADDSDQLKMPGYVLVNPFVQFRPLPNLLVSVNCNNLFNALALTEVENPSMPASGVTQARVMTGRSVSTSVRFSF